MYYKTQDTNSLEYNTENGGFMIILGWYLGLGALIQSTVNSIWLAKKLGKTPYIYWWVSCLYSDKNSRENTYTKLFQEPLDHKLGKLSQELSVYPPAWMSMDLKETDVETLDLQAPILASSHNLQLISSSSEFILSTDICIIYQYLSSDLALSIANEIGLNISKEQFLQECNEIFTNYFQPQQNIKQSANTIWSNLFLDQQDYVIGIHLRGTDKVTEKAIPSPLQYFNAIQKVENYNKNQAFFIATDSQSYLENIKNKLGKQAIVGVQNMERARGKSGLHFNPHGAFENAINMIIDIELLSKCRVVFAFPGSQIFWWLSRKQAGENLHLTLLPVNPGWLDWIHAGWTVFRLQGLNGLLNFLRFQKSRFISSWKSRNRL
jgi:hypothetical protein